MKEHPLVLLHVTILPIVAPYSQEVLESVLPGYALENWKLLRETVTDTVLERGILVPHPREDYDLLEERLLESLELKVPRILKCGHFHLEDGEGETEEEEEGYESDDDADLCGDCGRRIRDGRFGSGTGSKRWEIRIYAANGLMRAGAWGAAWREMERVDVEISPWVEDSVRRELELRREEEIRNREEEMRRVAPEHHCEVPLHDQGREVDPGRGGIDIDRMREVYGEDAQAYIDGLQEEAQVKRPRERRRRRKGQHVELLVLLRNYVHLMLQDRRNVAILLLSLLVAFLSLGAGKPSKEIWSPEPERHQTPPVPSSIATIAEPGLSTSIPWGVDPATAVMTGFDEPNLSTLIPSALDSATSVMEDLSSSICAFSLTAAAPSSDLTTSNPPYILKDEAGIEATAAEPSENIGL